MPMLIRSSMTRAHAQTPIPPRDADLARRRPGAFTLIELVVASSITTIILGAIASVVVIASRALPDSGPYVQAADNSRLLQEFASEVALATTITDHSTVRLEFTLPDQSADGTPEIVAYEYSSGKGTFSRTFNGVTTHELADVTDAYFTYRSHRVGTPPSPTSNTSPVTTLLNLSGPANGSITLASTSRLAQGFVPVLPNGATSWSISGVWVHLSSNPPTSGTLVVALSKTDALTGLPGAELATASIAESALPATAAWHSVPLSYSGLAPGDGVAIDITQSGNNSAAIVSIMPDARPIELLGSGWITLYRRTLSLMVPDTSWNIMARVEGTYVSVTTPPDTRPTAIDGVTLTITSTTGTLRTGARLANAPQVP
jgi:hypothetical protein